LYVFTWFYEWGYTSYFHVPSTLVEIGVGNLLWCGSILVVTSAFALIPLVAIVVTPRYTAEWAGRWFGVLNGAVLAIMIWAYVRILFVPEFISGWQAFMVAVGVWLSLILYAYCVGRLGDKWAESEEAKPGGGRLPMLEHMYVNWFSFKPLLGMHVFTAVLHVVLTGLTLGRLEAKAQTQFAFVDESSEVILRRYGQRYVLAKYDGARGLILPKFRVVLVDELKSGVTAASSSRVLKPIPFAARHD
jgi:hypothetical protein